MDDKEYINELEDLLARLLKPMKNIPYTVIIKSIANQQVIPLNIETNDIDKELLMLLKESINHSYRNGFINSIQSNRVNEVGNKIEEPVINGINDASLGIKATRPTTQSGKFKSTGYPDILLFDKYDRPTYLEIKTYNKKNKDTTQRTFYLSPSDDPKIIYDARHLLIGFEIESIKDKTYSPSGFEILDLSGIMCDLKHEFITSNRYLYNEKHVVYSQTFT